MLIILAMLTGCGNKTPSNSTKNPEELCVPGDTISAGIIENAGYVETSTPGSVLGTYEIHGPILIKNVHASVGSPYVVEGYEISSDTSNCIEVKNSENVIIRNNYLHDCTWSKDPDEPYSSNEGFSILVGESENITIESNVLDNNKMGFVAYSSSNIKLLQNTIKKTIVKNSGSSE